MTFPSAILKIRCYKGVGPLYVVLLSGVPASASVCSLPSSWDSCVMLPAANVFGPHASACRGSGLSSGYAFCFDFVR